MKELGMIKIDVSKPIAKKYLDTIRFWDEEGKFAKILGNTTSNNEESNNNSRTLFGVIYGDRFLGASVLEMNSETMEASAHIINGSLQHQEEIDEFLLEELKEVAYNMYGTKEVAIACKQERSNKKKLALFK